MLYLTFIIYISYISQNQWSTLLNFTCVLISTWWSYHSSKYQNYVCMFQIITLSFGAWHIDVPMSWNSPTLHQFTEKFTKLRRLLKFLPTLKNLDDSAVPSCLAKIGKNFIYHLVINCENHTKFIKYLKRAINRQKIKTNSETLYKPYECL